MAGTLRILSLHTLTNQNMLLFRVPMNSIYGFILVTLQNSGFWLVKVSIRRIEQLPCRCSARLEGLGFSQAKPLRFIFCLFPPSRRTTPKSQMQACIWACCSVERRSCSCQNKPESMRQQETLHLRDFVLCSSLFELAATGLSGSLCVLVFFSLRSGA